MKKKLNSEIDYPDDWLKRELTRIQESRGEWINTRYYVVEITPSQHYRKGDGHGGSESAWTRGSIVRVSPYYPDELQAEAFMNDHEPDEGKTLSVRSDKLYRKVVETWY